MWFVRVQHVLFHYLQFEAPRFDELAYELSVL